jgi:hypothetical protein
MGKASHGVREAMEGNRRVEGYYDSLKDGED